MEKRIYLRFKKTMETVNLFDLLTDKECFELSVINSLDQDYEKELKFWKKFWRERNIYHMEFDVLTTKVNNINMPEIAWWGFRYELSPNDGMTRYFKHQAKEKNINHNKVVRIVSIYRDIVDYPYNRVIIQFMSDDELCSTVIFK